MEGRNTTELNQNQGIKEGKISTPYSSVEIVFEEYLLETLIQIIKSLERDSSRKNKILILDKLIQNNIFLMKRMRDPGFFQYVGKVLLEDPKFKVLATQYIMREINEHLSNARDFFNPFLRIQDWNETNYPITSPHLPGITYPSSKSEIKKAVSKYFDDRLIAAKMEGNIAAMQAVTILQKEYNTDRFILPYILQPILQDPSSDDPITKMSINAHKDLVTHQNIPLWELYEQPLNPPEYFLFQSPEYEDLYLWIEEQIQRSTGIPLEVSLAFNKFTKDIVTNLSLKWFDLKSPEEKWKILAKEYVYEWKEADFEKFAVIHKKITIDPEKLVKTLLEVFPTMEKPTPERSPRSGIEDFYSKYGNELKNLPSNLHILYYIVGEQGRYQYWENAINGFIYLFKNSSNKRLRSNFCQNIGYALYQVGKYSEAIRFYEMEADFLKNADIYMYEIGLKNKVLCYTALNDSNNAELTLKELKDLFPRLEPKQQALLGWNLANLHRDIHRYKEEYDTLLQARKALSELRGLDELMAKVEHRIANIEAKTNRGLQFNESQLQRDDIKEQIDKHIRWFEYFKIKFQFTQAESQLKCALKLGEEHLNGLDGEYPFILEHLCQFYILTKQKEKFCQLYSKFLEKEPSVVLRIFRETIKIFENDFEMTSILGDIFKNYSSIVSSNFFKTPNRTILSEKTAKNMPIIFPLLAPLINFKYPKTPKIINSIIQLQKSARDQIVLLWELGQIFIQDGNLEDALIYTKKAESLDNSSAGFFYDIYSQLAEIYLKQDDYQNALISSQSAGKHLPNNDEIKCKFYTQFAELYYFMDDLPKAISMLEDAISINPSPQLIDLKEFYISVRDSKINLRGIASSEIRNVLRSADYTFIKLSEMFSDMDYSLIIIGYCKAMEMLLDKQISHRITLDSVIIQFQDPGSGYPHKIRKNVWKNLEPPLQNFLDNNKSISLGQWGRIFANLEGDINHFQSHAIYFSFLTQIKQLLTLNKIGILKQACNELVEKRNDAAHITYHEKSEFLQFRPIIINKINEIISAFN